MVVGIVGVVGVFPDGEHAPARWGLSGLSGLSGCRGYRGRSSGGWGGCRGCQLSATHASFTKNMIAPYSLSHSLNIHAPPHMHDQTNLEASAHGFCGHQHRTREVIFNRGNLASIDSLAPIMGASGAWWGFKIQQPLQHIAGRGTSRELLASGLFGCERMQLLTGGMNNRMNTDC